MSFLPLIQKLRLTVARYGEKDRMSWWGSDRVLGSMGPKVFQRGFPRTSLFAQARVVEEVARTRSREVFSPPQCITLWELPPSLEDDLDGAKADWMENQDEWTPFFEDLAKWTSGDLVDFLMEHGLCSPEVRSQLDSLKRSAESKAVDLGSMAGAVPNEHELMLMAASFSKGELSKPLVPYFRA